MVVGISKNPQLNPREGKRTEKIVGARENKLPKKQGSDLPEIKVKTSQAPPSVEATAFASPEKEQAGEELIEKAPEEFLNKAREKYLRAKLEFNKHYKAIPEGEELAEEKRKIIEEFQKDQKEYFTERQIYLQQRLNAAEREMDEKGLKEEERKSELEKGRSQFLVSEFKEVYDLKSRLEAEAQESATKSGVLSVFYKVAEDYKKASLKQKLILAGLLAGGAVVAAGTGGGVGMALGALMTGQYTLQRVLASGALSIGLEGWIKGSQQKALNAEATEKYQKAISESLEKGEAKTAAGMVNFLKLRDSVMEDKAAEAMGDVKNLEVRMRYRRYFLAGTLGTLIGSGVAVKAIGNVIKLFGGGAEELVATPEEIAKEKVPLVPEGATPEEIVKASENLTNPEGAAEVAAGAAKENLFTIEKGGSVSQAAQSLAAEAKMSPEDYQAAWSNSTVEINGVKVPIEDVSLVHEGDQVRYFPGGGEAPGHFELIDVKDKLSIGTNQDLYAVYEKVGKQPPRWLETSVAEDAAEALKDNQLDANEIRNLNFHFDHGNLGEKQDIIDSLNNKVEALGAEAGRSFADLRDSLTTSRTYTNSVEAYNDYIWGNTRLSLGQYDAIKDMKVKEFLANRGHSWWHDYFASPDMPYASPQEARAEEIFRQRKLASLLRIWYSADKANITIEQFLQRMPTPWY